MSTNGSSSSTTNGVDTASPTSPSSASSGAAGAAGAGALVPSGPPSGRDRLRELEALFWEGPDCGVHEAKAFSTETLLDILLVLYNECANSSLKKEKTVTDFIELGKTGLPFLPRDSCVFDLCSLLPRPAVFVKDSAN